MAGQTILLKELLLEIGYIEQRRTTRQKKRSPKPCSTIPFAHKNKFNLFDSVPLATLRFEISLHHKRMTHKKNYGIMNTMFTGITIQHRVAYCAKIFLSHPLLMLRNFRTKDCQWYVVKCIKSFCR